MSWSLKACPPEREREKKRERERERESCNPKASAQKHGRSARARWSLGWQSACIPPGTASPTSCSNCTVPRKLTTSSLHERLQGAKTQSCNTAIAIYSPNSPGRSSLTCRLTMWGAPSPLSAHHLLFLWALALPAQPAPLLGWSLSLQEGCRFLPRPKRWVL